MRIKIGDEKGFTAIEMLISFTILMITIVVFYGFLSGYYYKKNEVGESLTAKTLVVKYVEKESNELVLGNTKSNLEYVDTDKVKNTLFTTKVSVKDITNEVDYYTDVFKIYEVKATVYWKKRNYEVITYVDQNEK
jgi:competence protein ComGC